MIEEIRFILHVVDGIYITIHNVDNMNSNKNTSIITRILV